MQVNLTCCRTTLLGQQPCEAVLLASQTHGCQRSDSQSIRLFDDIQQQLVSGVAIYVQFLLVMDGFFDAGAKLTQDACAFVLLPMRQVLLIFAVFDDWRQNTIIRYGMQSVEFVVHAVEKGNPLIQATSCGLPQGGHRGFRAFQERSTRSAR